ncbi:MAG: hypothetical protein A3F43_03920 [Gammaproteobacteria bacterium RIFCSPHIGHO2_12_FULL_42_10]|nr:MAG: hypothetical protein A3F43_03920 [Gammaproteobacteria bacterium RIFCSPHIGHO2_12_FULL_42_10]
MHIRNGQLTLIICTLLYASFCQGGQLGATLSLPLYAKEPTPINGFQFMLSYDPRYTAWHQVNLYFDGGFSHLTTDTPVTTINIYSAAPVVRYAFERHGIMRPFLDLSIGLAYLNHTHLGHRNLGIHMAFQDRIGIGALFGEAERWSLGLQAMHYSNAHLSSHNSGITIPLVLNMGYRF